jgi:integrase
VVAQSLFAARLAELADARNNATVAPVRRKPGLAEVVKEHITAKEREGMVTADWVECAGIFLGRAVAFFGAERRLGSIDVQDVVEWIQFLREVRFRRSRAKDSPERPLSDGTIRHRINALSNLFRRAQRWKYVPIGYNPVALLERGERPAIPKSSTAFLEVPSVALLFEAARTYSRTKREPEMAIAHAVLATLVLTGGRKSEVLGLELNDISFDRKTVTFRPNQWRGKDGRGRDRLKTVGSQRVVPLWPQLEELLRPHVWERLQAGGSLLSRHRTCRLRHRSVICETCWIGWRSGRATPRGEFALGCSASRMLPPGYRRWTGARPSPPGRWSGNSGTVPARCWSQCTAGSAIFATGPRSWNTASINTSKGAGIGS